MARIDVGINGNKDREGILTWILDRMPRPTPTSPIGQLHAALVAVDRAFAPLSALLANHLLPPVRARLERRKREAGLFDFQDMLTLVARNLEGDSARARALLGALRARYRYALVDEFQDTDETQWQIFRRLFFERGSDRGAHAGRRSQAGDLFVSRRRRAYLPARARTSSGRCRSRSSSTASYRATPSLIAAQNALLEQSEPAPFFRDGGPIRYQHPVTCGRPDRALVDARGETVAPVVVLDVVRAPEKTGPRLNFQEIKPALLDRITREIQRLLTDGRPAFAPRRRQPRRRSARATSSCSRGPSARAARSARRCARAASRLPTSSRRSCSIPSRPTRCWTCCARWPSPTIARRAFARSSPDSSA